MFFYNSIFLPSSDKKHRNIKYYKENLLRAKINKILKRQAFKKWYLYSLKVHKIQIYKKHLGKVKYRNKIRKIIKTRFYNYGLEIPYAIDLWLNN